MKKNLWGVCLNLLLSIPFSSTQAASSNNFDAQKWMVPWGEDPGFQYELYQNCFSGKQPNYYTETYQARDWVQELKTHLENGENLTAILYNKEKIYLLDYLKAVKAEYCQKISLLYYLSPPRKFLEFAYDKSKKMDIVMQKENDPKFGDIGFNPLAPRVNPPQSNEIVFHPLSLHIHHRIHQLNLCTTVASIVLPSLAIVNHRYPSSQQKNLMIAFQGMAILSQYFSYKWGQFDDSPCSFVKYQEGSFKKVSHRIKLLACLFQYFVTRDSKNSHLRKAAQFIGLLEPAKKPFALTNVDYQGIFKSYDVFDTKLQCAVLALKSVSLCIDIGNKMHQKNRAFKAFKEPYERKIQRYTEGIELVENDLKKRCTIVHMCMENSLTDIVGVEAYSSDVGDVIVSFLYEKDERDYYKKVLRDDAQQLAKQKKSRQTFYKVSSGMAWFVTVCYLIKRRFS